MIAAENTNQQSTVTYMIDRILKKKFSLAINLTKTYILAVLQHIGTYEGYNKNVTI